MCRLVGPTATTYCAERAAPTSAPKSESVQTSAAPKSESVQTICTEIRVGADISCTEIRVAADLSCTVYTACTERTLGGRCGTHKAMDWSNVVLFGIRLLL